MWGNSQQFVLTFVLGTQGLDEMLLGRKATNEVDHTSLSQVTTS